MNKAEDFLPAFKMLIKNRLGPYKIVIKNDLVGRYCTDSGIDSLNRDEATNYAYRYVFDGKCCARNDCKVYNRGHKMFLMSSAIDDIPLTEKDFKLNSLE